MRRHPWLVLVVLVVVFGGLLFMMVGRSVSRFMDPDDLPSAMAPNTILRLELDGVIMDGKKFLKQLKKYREDKNVKAIVVEINSPGGVVGPSQEIYEEIKRTRTEFKKPVVAVSTGLMASGAYYSAIAADKIIVSPGVMMGSIGVIMEFINLEKLYDWAKVSRYTITTGRYKDSGAEYRAMRDDERALFQELVNDVYMQFKTAVAESRKLEMSVVDKFADGRVFTGTQGVKNGFADEVGTVDHAYDVAAELADIKKFEIFEVPKKRPSIWELLPHDEDEFAKFDHVIKGVLKTELANRPLYMLPGSW